MDLHTKKNNTEESNPKTLQEIIVLGHSINLKVFIYRNVTFPTPSQALALSNPIHVGEMTEGCYSQLLML